MSAKTPRGKDGLPLWYEGQYRTITKILCALARRRMHGRVLCAYINIIPGSWTGYKLCRNFMPPEKVERAFKFLKLKLTPNDIRPDYQMKDTLAKS